MSSSQRLQHNRHAHRFATAAALADEVSARLLERLQIVKIDPTRVLDVGSGAGRSLAGLHAQYPRAQLIALDHSLMALRDVPVASGVKAWIGRVTGSAGTSTPRVCAEADTLPLAANSVDLVWCNLALARGEDLAAAIREWRRVLRVGGLAMFSFPGPDTLRELRAALGQTQSPFPDMHDIGDAVVGAGFADPVMDVERLTMRYRSAQGILDDLRAYGLLQRSGTGLATPRAQARLSARVQAMLTGDTFPITVELCYGHAWKAEPKTTEAGDAIVRFAKRSPRRM